MESSTRNLIITLALPHLSREEDRVAFLAEQAVLGALYLRGPEVAREVLRVAAETLGNPLSREMFVDPLVDAIARWAVAVAKGDAAPPAAEPADPKSEEKPAPAASTARSVVTHKPAKKARRSR